MKKIIVYTDGGSRGIPGKAAIGVVFCNEKGQIIIKFSEYLGDNLTNNDAEYKAIIFALKKFKTFFGKVIAETSDVEFRADSELVVKQLNGVYRLTDPKIQQFFIEIWNLKFDFKSVKFKHISRDRNKEADRIVNEVLDQEANTKALL
jgi:ribonuclease HI